jgi:hypothetical protein
VNFKIRGESNPNSMQLISESTNTTKLSTESTQYLFKSANLGWINCDMFINDKKEKTNFAVNIKHAYECDVLLVFHNIKSVMPSRLQNGIHTFNNIPVEEEVTIIVIRKINNIPEFAINETVTSSKPELDFTFQSISIESLKNKLLDVKSFNN